MIKLQTIALNVKIKESKSLYLLMKRTFDVFLAVLLLITLTPIMILFSLVIFIETKSNPIYIQDRALTLNDRRFRLFKFRTLSKDETSEDRDPILIKENLTSLVTKSGWVLRKTGLDELPQLINIILGDMSFIGPRPLSMHDLETLRSSEGYLYTRREMIKSKPGISGYWQIYGNRSKGVQDLIEHEEYYEQNKSFILDLFLVFMTIPVVLFAKHSDAIVGKK